MLATRRRILHGLAALAIMPRLASASIPGPPTYIIIYDASTPASLTDALWYCAARGLPVNTIGFNFGGATQFAWQDLDSGSIVCQAMTYQGSAVTDSRIIGQNISQAILAFPAVGISVNGLLTSTYTPWTVTLPSNQQSIFPGYISQYVATNISSRTGIVPNGRLGAPSNPSNGSWNSATELVPKSGGNLLRQCVTAALAAEKADNRLLAHCFSTSMAYTDYVSAGDNAASYALAQRQGLSSLYNLPSNFLNGVSSQQLFACCVGGVIGESGYAGNETYSNNYVPQHGAWGFLWESFCYHFAFDLLWNGGSAAFSTSYEPTAEGLRDPQSVFQLLYTQGLQLAQILPLVSLSAPGDLNQAPVPVSNWFNLSVIGDPAYAPYKATVSANPLISIGGGGLLQL